MKDSTRIVIVLDRSGSMQSCRESTIKGLNTFVSEQKKIPGDVKLTLIQFDDNLGELSYEIVKDGPLSVFSEFTQQDFVPRGSTPLYDAQGKAITELGVELSLLPEADRPSKVLFVTITDGHENSSKKYSLKKIAEMVEHQTKVYNWDFVYLGANQDAIKVGSTIGVRAAKAMRYNSFDSAAVGATYSNLSKYAARARRGIGGQSIQDNSFTEEERETSVGK